MLTQIDLDEVPAWVTSIMEPTLWWVGVALFGVMALYFFKRYQQRKGEPGATFLAGLLVFSLGYGIGRLLENIRKYHMIEERNDIFYGWIGLADPISGTNLIIRTLYYVFCWIAIAFFMYHLETLIFQKKTHYIFTVAAIGEGIVSIAQYYTFDDVSLVVIAVLSTIGCFVAGLTPIALYFRMGLKSTGIIRRSCLLATVGMTLFVIGVMTDLPEAQLVIYLTNGVPLSPWLTSVLAPISLMLGVVLLTVSFRMMFADLF
jgi:hypothetical protein